MYIQYKHVNKMKQGPDHAAALRTKYIIPATTYGLLDDSPLSLACFMTIISVFNAIHNECWKFTTLYVPSKFNDHARCHARADRLVASRRGEVCTSECTTTVEVILLVVVVTQTQAGLVY